MTRSRESGNGPEGQSPELWAKQAAAREGTNGFLAPGSEATPPPAPAKKAAKKATKKAAKK